jgi:hypothetical protein
MRRRRAHEGVCMQTHPQVVNEDSVAARPSICSGWGGHKGRRHAVLLHHQRRLLDRDGKAQRVPVTRRALPYVCVPRKRRG